MKLEALSEEANSRLFGHLEKCLSGTSATFREDVLYAARNTAPLRERTYLVRLASKIAGIDDWTIVEPFAFAAELFIISALTADDAIDGADSRSGAPTLFSKRGVACSMLVAEWFHGIAQVTLWDGAGSVSDKIWREATKRFHSAYSTFFFSQYLESHEEGNQYVTLEEIDKLSRGRTGQLLEACLASSAIISASQQLENALSECGRWFGTAFQHRDDILDFIGDPEVIGKPILQNLFSGQPNLVLSHVFTKATDQSARAAILKYFGKTGSGIDLVGQGDSIQQDILSVLRTSGSLVFAAQVVRDYCNRAIGALDGVSTSQAKDELVELIELVGSVELPWEDS